MLSLPLLAPDAFLFFLGGTCNIETNITSYSLSSLSCIVLSERGYAGAFSVGRGCWERVLGAAAGLLTEER